VNRLRSSIFDVSDGPISGIAIASGDGETVTPSLPEPGVWTGMAQANVWAPLRWKRAKIHRGSR
jgi:hypothetical protein